MTVIVVPNDGCHFFTEKQWFDFCLCRQHTVMYQHGQADLLINLIHTSDLRKDVVSSLLSIIRPAR